MDSRNEEQEKGRWGAITVNDRVADGAQPGIGQAVDAPFAVSRYIWRPLPTLDLPPDFELVLDCITDRSGIRRFVPENGARAFIIQAALAGQSILNASGLLNHKQLQSYRLMTLIFQRANRCREHFDRTFKRAQDLYILQSLGIPDKDVLPDDVGLDSLGRGDPWTVGELLARGREAAEARGCSDLNESTWIRLGIAQAAQLNPIPVDTEDGHELRQLVRISLFDLGPATDRTLSEHKRVHDRLLAALERHRADSTDSFNHWFYEQIDNLVRQVSKKKNEGGPIQREVVRQVLLELTFDAYEYIAHSVAIFMSAFVDTLHSPLSTRERRIVDVLYGRQRALGGLSLIILHNRFPLEAAKKLKTKL